mmetsp:Transcript_4438/g.18019  ORF Transcript_4438/g.18019 Transcript_4438/m.18019 type:complete len:214 (-) Transcript_4438:1110-1751(-)
MRRASAARNVSLWISRVIALRSICDEVWSDASAAQPRKTPAEMTRIGSVPVARPTAVAVLTVVTVVAPTKTVASSSLCLRRSAMRTHFGSPGTPSLVPSRSMTPSLSRTKSRGARSTSRLTRSASTDRVRSERSSNVVRTRTESLDRLTFFFVVVAASSPAAASRGVRNDAPPPSRTVRGSSVSSASSSSASSSWASSNPARRRAASPLDIVG